MPDAGGARRSKMKSELMRASSWRALCGESGYFRTASTDPAAYVWLGRLATSHGAEVRSEEAGGARTV